MVDSYTTDIASLRYVAASYTDVENSDVPTCVMFLETPAMDADEMSLDLNQIFYADGDLRVSS